MSSFVVAALALGSLGIPGPAAAQGQGPGAGPGTLPFESYHLANGLHVILAPDPDATATAVNLWYRVGSRDERPGRSGFGHLFEHLMFQGSENVGEGEHFQHVERAGGNLNASITEDRTNYFQTVPPERMNLALWLEADRMRSLRVTEENLRREVEVVKEERRLRIDNSPYGTSQLQMSFYAPYDAEGCFAYAHSVIGSMEDLDAAELTDVQDFFDLYYAPNNATLVVAGAFDPEEARALIAEYFGSIPRGSDPPEVRCDRPFQHLPVEERIHDPNAQLPGLFVAYGGVEHRHPDAPALTLLADILGGGQSARLNQHIVREAQAALQAVAIHAPRLGPGLVQFILIANQGVESEELLALLDAEIDALLADGVTEAEVDRARNRALASTVLSRQTALGRAEALQSANHFHGTPDAVTTVVEALQSVTRDDVNRVARSYLQPDRRAVIFTIPGPRPEGEDR
jgi:zinc protease